MEIRSVQTNTHGAALLFFVMFFMAASIPLVFLMSKSIYADLAAYRILNESKLSYMSALSANEDIAYRYLSNLLPDSVETITIGGVPVTSTIVYDGVSDTYTVTSSATLNSVVRDVEVVLQVSNGVTFNFGLQSGQGGLEMHNTSQIIGNVHSNGTITGDGNMIKGDVISAGATGFVGGIHATGSVYSNTIDANGVSDTEIDGDAYYQTIDLGDVTVHGTTHPGSPDVATATFPISDDVIFDWEAEAEAGGTYSGPCPYVIQSDTTIGPLKIPCDFKIEKNNTDVYLTGPIWVTGDFSTKNGPVIHVDPSLPDTIVPIIADDPSDRITGSTVSIENSTNFLGASGVSHVLVISMNEDEEVNYPSGTTIALNGGQSGQGDVIFYAPHGRASVSNSGRFTELTAYTIEMSNSVKVIFDSGLANPNFQGGPSATFSIISWDEVE